VARRHRELWSRGRNHRAYQSGETARHEHAVAHPMTVHISEEVAMLIGLFNPADGTRSAEPAGSLPDLGGYGY
jgi:hypothetical protein